MSAPIGPGHGIDGARLALIANDPEGAEAYRKLMAPQNPSKGYEGTMHRLVQGHNEVWSSGGLADQIAGLREEIRLRPFS